LPPPKKTQKKHGTHDAPAEIIEKNYRYYTFKFYSRSVIGQQALWSPSPSAVNSFLKAREIFGARRKRTKWLYGL
jgi:hypothetical protein